MVKIRLVWQILATLYRLFADTKIEELYEFTYRYEVGYGMK